MAGELTCPGCGAELSIEQLFDHAEVRDTFARLIRMSVPGGAKLLAYVALFAGLKNRQTIPRKVRLLEELMPDLQRQAINRKGRDWHVPVSVWISAIDEMLAARDAGKLKLPLTTHGYLYEILVTHADKAEAAAEEQREAQQRGRAHGTGSADVLTVLQGMASTAPAQAPAAASVAARIAPAPYVPGSSPTVRRIRAELAARGNCTPPGAPSSPSQSGVSA